MRVRVDTVAATALVQAVYRFIEDVQVGRRDDYDEGYSELIAEGFELRLPPGYPEGEQAFRGRAGLKRWINGILVLIRIVARGHRSGVALDRETAHIWSTADGRVTRCEVYFDRSEALRAVED